PHALVLAPEPGALVVPVANVLGPSVPRPAEDDLAAVGRAVEHLVNRRGSPAGRGRLDDHVLAFLLRLPGGSSSTAYVARARDALAGERGRDAVQAQPAGDLAEDALHDLGLLGLDGQDGGGQRVRAVVRVAVRGAAGHLAVVEAVDGCVL